MDSFIKIIKQRTLFGFSNYPEKDRIKHYTFMALLAILHESSHVWQLKGLEDYTEINRLNHDVHCPRTLPLIKAIRLKINLARINERDYFERQANIDALRELVDMYQGYEFLNFIKLQHIYNLSGRKLF